MIEVCCILFNEFETLDVFGPVEILGLLDKHFEIKYYSKDGGITLSSQKVPIVTENFDQLPHENFILFVPGGWGTRAKIADKKFVNILFNLASKANYILTVCTGSPLLAKTGFLNGKNATTNKIAFDLGPQTNDKVNWIREARWVVDNQIYTSSGVTAGMDMTLAFVADYIDYETAKKVSNHIEYVWNEDSGNDPFA